MILPLFAVIAALGLAGVFLGYFTGDGHYAVVGLVFLFLLGTVMFSNNLEVKTGEVHNTTFVYLPNSTQVDTTNNIITYQYSNFTGDFARMMGIFLSIASFAGVAIILYNHQLSRRDD